MVNFFLAILTLGNPILVTLVQIIVFYLNTSVLIFEVT